MAEWARVFKTCVCMQEPELVQVNLEVISLEDPEGEGLKEVTFEFNQASDTDEAYETVTTVTAVMPRLWSRAPEGVEDARFSEDEAEEREDLRATDLRADERPIASRPSEEDFSRELQPPELDTPPANSRKFEVSSQRKMSKKTLSARQVHACLKQHYDAWASDTISRKRLERFQNMPKDPQTNLVWWQWVERRSNIHDHTPPRPQPAFVLEREKAARVGATAQVFVAPAVERCGSPVKVRL